MDSVLSLLVMIHLTMKMWKNCDNEEKMVL